MVVPFGTVPGTHTWLHSECWPAVERGAPRGSDHSFD